MGNSRFIMAKERSEILILPPDDLNKKQLGFKFFELDSTDIVLSSVRLSEIKARRFYIVGEDEKYIKYHKNIFYDISERFEILDL